MKKIGSALGGLLALLLVVAGVYVAATWAPDRPVAELKPRWAPPPSTFVEINGMQVHIRDEGPRNDPLPIVLLHGTSASLHTWQGWVAALKGEHRVISVDMPGFGLTGPTPDGDYSMKNYVKFVLAVLDKQGVSRCVIAGNSFGGYVAWETAWAAPLRVQKLILVDAGGYPVTAASMPIGFRIAKIPVLNKLMEKTLPRGMIESSVRNVYGDPSKVTPELVDRYYELTLREGNRAALVQRFRQAPAGGDAQRIPDITMPTLILWGGKDHLIPQASGEHFQKDIKGSQLVVFNGLGHVPHEEDPVSTVAVVKQFLAGK